MPKYYMICLGSGDSILAVSGKVCGTILGIGAFACEKFRWQKGFSKQDVSYMYLFSTAVPAFPAVPALPDWQDPGNIALRILHAPNPFLTMNGAALTFKQTCQGCCLHPVSKAMGALPRWDYRGAGRSAHEGRWYEHIGLLHLVFLCQLYFQPGRQIR